MGNSEKRKKKTSPVFIIIIIVCVIVIVYALYNIISIQMNYKAASDEYENIKESVVTENDTSGIDTADGTTKEGNDAADESKIAPPLNVDHKTLLSQNSDYAGWLYIEALGISYPIMQSTDNDFYLHRTFEKEILFAGSIFMDFNNKKDMSDPNTIIYGHNMKDDSMFGNLNLLYDSQLINNSDIFWILTPNGNYRYKIFSMQYCEDTSDVYTLFTGGSIFTDYIAKMKSQSLVDLGEISYDENSKVATLSTCVYAEGTARFVVQGIRVQ